MSTSGRCGARRSRRCRVARAPDDAVARRRGGCTRRRRATARRGPVSRVRQWSVASARRRCACAVVAGRAACESEVSHLASVCSPPSLGRRSGAASFRRARDAEPARPREADRGRAARVRCRPSTREAARAWGPRCRRSSIARTSQRCSLGASAACSCAASCSVANGAAVDAALEAVDRPRWRRSRRSASVDWSGSAAWASGRCSALVSIGRPCRAVKVRGGRRGDRRVAGAGSVRARRDRCARRRRARSGRERRCVAGWRRRAPRSRPRRSIAGSPGRSRCR